MKKLLSSLFVLALCSSVAMATVPDPGNCDVTPDLTGGVFIAPNDPAPISAQTLTITVHNASNNPIPNAAVEVIFDAAVCICANAVHTGTTDANGQVDITVTGGGCVQNTAGAARVLANGIEIWNFTNVKSTDNDTHTTTSCNGGIDVGDLVIFASEWNGIEPADCHDYDNNASVDVGDLTWFGYSFSTGLNCAL